MGESTAAGNRLSGVRVSWPWLAMIGLIGFWVEGSGRVAVSGVVGLRVETSGLITVLGRIIVTGVFGLGVGTSGIFAVL